MNLKSRTLHGTAYATAPACSLIYGTSFTPTAMLVYFDRANSQGTFRKLRMARELSQPEPSSILGPKIYRQSQSGY